MIHPDNTVYCINENVAIAKSIVTSLYGVRHHVGLPIPLVVLVKIFVHHNLIGMIRRQTGLRLILVLTNKELLVCWVIQIDGIANRNLVCGLCMQHLTCTNQQKQCD